ncbi:MAG TPA: hypothetical protein VEA81_03780 [Burkholderiaceae bacterium]|nr:hypothetical protein [Burkholderiaceae bacterium]
MKQREVQDDDRTRWTCAQALAGVDGDAADVAQRKADADGAPVAVVCTPSGGARSVRLALASGWDTAMTDEALVAAIRDAAGRADAR